MASPHLLYSSRERAFSLRDMLKMDTVRQPRKSQRLASVERESPSLSKQGQGTVERESCWLMGCFIEFIENVNVRARQYLRTAERHTGCWCWPVSLPVWAQFLRTHRKVKREPAPQSSPTSTTCGDACATHTSCVHIEYSDFLNYKLK